MGSICSAVIVCRLCSLPDPREEGSKNPGATNVLRIAGKQYAALVMLADILKGTIPVLIAKAFDAEPATVAFTALAAVVGHIFPVFFGFRGGKGVATAIGALLGFHFIVGVMVVATWLIIANFGRYASLASIVAIALAPFYTLFLVHRTDILTPLFIIVILILFKHKSNITRLIDGTEPKIKLKPNLIEDIMAPPHTPVIIDTHDADFPEEQTKELHKEKKSAKVIKTAKPATKKISTEEPTKKVKTVKPKTTKVTETEKAKKKPVKKPAKPKKDSTP